MNCPVSQFEKNSRCGTDWLPSSAPLTRIEERQPLPPIPDKIFERILDSVWISCNPWNGMAPTTVLRSFQASPASATFSTLFLLALGTLAPLTFGPCAAQIQSFITSLCLWNGLADSGWRTSCIGGPLTRRPLSVVWTIHRLLAPARSLVVGVPCRAREPSFDCGFLELGSIA